MGWAQALNKTQIQLYNYLKRHVKHSKRLESVLKKMLELFGDEKTLYVVKHFQPKDWKKVIELGQYSPFWELSIEEQLKAVEELKGKFPVKEIKEIQDELGIWGTDKRDLEHFLLLIKYKDYWSVLYFLINHPEVKDEETIKWVIKTTEKVAEHDGMWRASLYEWYGILKKTANKNVFILVYETIDYAPWAELFLEDIQTLIDVKGFMEIIPELLEQPPRERSYFIYKLYQSLDDPPLFRKAFGEKLGLRLDSEEENKIEEDF